MRAIVFSAVLFSMGFLPLGAAVAGSPEPHQLLRALMQLQQRAIKGDLKAHEKRPEFMKIVERGIRSADREKWQSEKNVESIIVYLLSGASAESAKQVVLGKETSKLHRNLFQGALAFSRGELARARSRLGRVSISQVNSLIGGPLGLAMASIHLQKSPEIATKLYEEVELLAPGTIYEETALRRHVRTLDQTRNLTKFADLVQRYERRFPKSPYAQRFRRYVISVIGRVLLESVKFDDEKLRKLIIVIPKGEQHKRLLEIAMRSIVVGRLGVTKWLSRYLCRDPMAPKLQRYAAMELLKLAAITTTHDKTMVDCKFSGIEPVNGKRLELLRSLRLHVQSLVRGNLPSAATAQTRSLNNEKSASFEKSSIVFRSAQLAVKSAQQVLSSENSK